MKHVREYERKNCTSYYSQVVLLRKLIFNSSVPQEELNGEQRKRIGYFLSEFVVQYRPIKRRNLEGKMIPCGINVSPNTLKTYILAVQRVIRTEFNAKKFNLMHLDDTRNIIENRFRELQALGNMTNSHNTLGIDDLKVIFDYLNEDAKKSAASYRDRLVFVVGLATGLRPTALRLLTVNQLQEEKLRGINCIVFRSVVGGTAGESKTDIGGWKGAGDRPRVIPIPDEILLQGRINFYGVIKEYLNIRKRVQTNSKQFFLSIKTTGKDRKSGDPNKYFTSQNLGKNTFSTIVERVCKKLGIRGDGAYSVVTAHGLRATIVTMLLEAGYDDATITLRTGHKDLKSLRSYHNLRGSIGLQQMKKMFGSDESLKKDGYEMMNGCLYDCDAKKDEPHENDTGNESKQVGDVNTVEENKISTSPKRGIEMRDVNLRAVENRPIGPTNSQLNNNSAVLTPNSVVHVTVNYNHFRHES